jgi:hypothetical protein
MKIDIDIDIEYQTDNNESNNINILFQANLNAKIELNKALEAFQFAKESKACEITTDNALKAYLIVAQKQCEIHRAYRNAEYKKLHERISQ